MIVTRGFTHTHTEHVASPQQPPESLAPSWGLFPRKGWGGVSCPLPLPGCLSNPPAAPSPNPSVRRQHWHPGTAAQRGDTCSPAMPREDLPQTHTQLSVPALPFSRWCWLGGYPAVTACCCSPLPCRSLPGEAGPSRGASASSGLRELCRDATSSALDSQATTLLRARRPGKLTFRNCHLSPGFLEYTN